MRCVMILTEPTVDYADRLKEYRREFLEYGGSCDGTGSFMRYEDPLEWLEKVNAFRDPKNVPQGYVPASQYIFVRESDGKIVGMIQIRHFLNEFLGKFGGNIGYSVAPSERRKGYASQMLAMALPECKKIGLDKILITCIRENEASRRTILKNGGIYESTVYEPDEKIYLERYWIDISQC